MLFFIGKINKKTGKTIAFLPFFYNFAVSFLTLKLAR